MLGGNIIGDRRFKKSGLKEQHPALWQHHPKGRRGVTDFLGIYYESNNTGQLIDSKWLFVRLSFIRKRKY